MNLENWIVVWWKGGTYLNNVEIDWTHELCSRRIIKFLQTVEEHIITHAMRSNRVNTNENENKKTYETNHKIVHDSGNCDKNAIKQTSNLLNRYQNQKAQVTAWMIPIDRVFCI